jgi:hypothetical protein
VELVDVSRTAVVFRQSGVERLDWAEVRKALAGARNGTVSLSDLEARGRRLRFLVGEVTRLLAAADAVILLSAPVEFESRQEPPDVPREHAGRLFFLRFTPSSPTPDLVGEEGPVRMGGPRRSQRPFEPIVRNTELDELEPGLKVLAPSVLPFQTAMEFRKVLARLRATLSRL